MQNYNSINRVTLAGVVNKELQLNYTHQDVPVVHTSLMTLTKHPKKRQFYKQITPLSAYENLALSMEEKMVKGSFVYIEGKLYIKEITLSDEQTQSKTHVVVDQFQVLSSESSTTSLFSH